MATISSDPVFSLTKWWCEVDGINGTSIDVLIKDVCTSCDSGISAFVGGSEAWEWTVIAWSIPGLGIQ